MNHEYINKSNLIDQYVLGKLTVDEAEAFELHFIECPECVDKLNATTTLVEDLKGLAVQETLVVNRKSVTPAWFIPFRISSPGLWAALACSCIVIAGVFGVFSNRRLTRLESELRQAKDENSVIKQRYEQGIQTAAQIEKQHEDASHQLTKRIDDLEQKLKNDKATVHSSDDSGINFPIYALVAALRAQDQPPTEVAPGSKKKFVFSIGLEDGNKFSNYRVTILNSRGTSVWKRSGFKRDQSDSLSLSLPSDFLNSGKYNLRVEGLTPPNEWSTLGNFPFHFVAPHK
jgi:hypothetical protein